MINVFFSSAIGSIKESNNDIHGNEDFKNARNNYNGKYPVGVARSSMDQNALKAETRVNVKVKGIRKNAATRDKDYILGGETITFSTYEKFRPLSDIVVVIPDDEVEGIERIVFYIDSVENGTIASPAETTVLIIDE